MLVPPEFRRGLTTAIGFITLIEAVYWALLTAYFVAVNGCVFDFPFVTRGVTEWNMFFVSYFMGNCAQGNTLQGDFNITTAPATAVGMQPWFIVYALSSSVWIPASVLLLAASIGRVRGTCASYLYYPWLLVTIFTIILDVVATAVHIEDVFNISSMADYGRFIGSTSFTNRDPSITPYLPALWITLFYIRFLILWIVNVVFFFIVFSVCKNVRNYKHRYQQTTLLTKNEIKRKSWLDAFYEGPDPSLVAERTRSERDDSGSEMSIRRDVVGIDNPLGTVDVHNADGDSDIGSRQLKDKPGSDVPNKSKWRVDEFGIPIEEIIPRPQSRQDSVELEEHPKTSPSLTQSTQDHVFDYLGRPTRVPSLRKIGREQPPPSRGPEHLPPAELRSQIPWSYFKPAEELPPKLQRYLQPRDVEDEEKPPVPVPDYTFHFSRRPRPVPESYAQTRFNLPVTRQRSFESYPSKPVPPKKPASLSGDYPLSPPPLSSSTRTFQQYPPQQDYAQSRYNPPPPRPPNPIMEGVEYQENSYPFPPRQQKRHEEYQPSNRNDVLPQEYIISPRQPSYYARQPSQEQNVGYSRMPVAV